QVLLHIAFPPSWPAPRRLFMMVTNGVTRNRQRGAGTSSPLPGGPPPEGVRRGAPRAGGAGGQCARVGARRPRGRGRVLARAGGGCTGGRGGPRRRQRRWAGRPAA